MKQKKDVRLVVRITSELKERLEGTAQNTGIPEPVVVVKCLEAYCDYVEQHGEAAFPLIVKPRSAELSGFNEPHTAAEDAGVVHRSSGKRNAPKIVATPPKEKRSHVSDVRQVSLSIFDTIPAGSPDDRRVVVPKRTVMVRKGKYPSDAFGLDVVGDSMNAAKGKLGPVLPGEVAVLTRFSSADEAVNKIVAAMIDGRSTLKRLIRPKGRDCYLRAESTNPAFEGDIRPLHDLEIQGVMIGKLNFSDKQAGSLHS